MSTAARTPRALAGAALVLGALTWLAVGAVRRSTTSPGADPWLVGTLTVAGAWLLLGALVTEQRRRVSAAERRRHPDLPVVLDADEVRGTSGGEPAWASRRTKASWRAAARRSWWPLLAAVLVALAVVLPIRTYRASDALLGADGVRVDGQVVASGWAYEGRGGRPVADISYVYNGTPRTARVAAPVPGTVPPGTTLPLRVDPDQPQHVRAESVPGTTAALEWWTTLGALLVLGLAGLALVSAARLLDRRRRLRTTPWTDAVLAGHGAIGLLRTADVTTPVRAPRRRLPTSPARVVPGPRGTVLAELPHGTHVELRLPATVIEGRRLLAALPDADRPPASGPRQQRDEEVPTVEGAEVPRREATVDA